MKTSNGPKAQRPQQHLSFQITTKRTTRLKGYFFSYKYTCNSGLKASEGPTMAAVAQQQQVNENVQPNEEVAAGPLPVDSLVVCLHYYGIIARVSRSFHRPHIEIRHSIYRK